MNNRYKKDCADCLSRRALLRGGVAVGAGTLAAAALPVGCMQADSPPAGPVAAGTVADIQVGMLKLIDGESVVLARDQEGLYAMTRVCTHQGQLVSLITAGGVPALHCYGHGSEFNMAGAVTRGPAERALDHFRVEVAAGNITIHADQVVSADTRTSQD